MPLKRIRVRSKRTEAIVLDRTLRRFVVLCISFCVLTSCSNAEKRFRTDLTSGRCDEALENLPSKDPLVKLGSRTEQAAGTVASYVFIGATYTVEVLWDIVGGTIGVVGLCAPMLVAQVAASSHGSERGMMKPVHCLPGSPTALMAPSLGKQAHQGTKSMRCPDLAGVSKSLRDVATCYQALGGNDNIKKARQSLESVKSSKDFYECLPQDEQAAIEKQLVSLSI
jgi:hypothetical protein